MTRLTISLPDNLHNRISSLSAREDESMSAIINRLIELGLYHLNEKSNNNELSFAEQYCQQQIIQMSALVKNLSTAILKYSQEDFEKLKQISLDKYNELVNI